MEFLILLITLGLGWVAGYFSGILRERRKKEIESYPDNTDLFAPVGPPDP